MTKLSKIKLEDIVYKSLQEELIELRKYKNLMLLNEDDDADLWGNLVNVATGENESNTDISLQPGAAGSWQRNVPIIGSEADFKAFMIKNVLPFAFDMIKVKMCNYLIGQFGVKENSLKAHIARAFVVELTLQDITQLLGLTDNPVLDCKHYAELIGDVITNVIGTYVLIPLLKSMYQFAANAAQGQGGDSVMCYQPIFGGSTHGGGGEYIGKFLGGSGGAFSDMADSACPPESARIPEGFEGQLTHINSNLSGGWANTIRSWESSFATVAVDRIDDYFQISDLMDGFIEDMMCENDESGISKFEGLKATGANLLNSSYSEMFQGIGAEGAAYAGDFASWLAGFLFSTDE